MLASATDVCGLMLTYADVLCSIFVVHNMGYQGVYPNPPNWDSPKFSLHDFGLRDDAYYDKFLWY